MKPLLSILICSIPSRWNSGIALFNKLFTLIGDKNIEILLLGDNKKRTIGEKREALKNVSNGKYFMFIDDDDDLYSVEELYKAAKNDVDVITFKVKCRNADGSEFIVTYGLGNEIEHNTKDGRYLDCKRPPFHQAAWNEKFKQIRFPKLNYAEDWGWAKVANEIAKTEIFIDKILVAYNFDPNVSEAVVKPRRAVVNYASGRYIKIQERLRNTLEGRCDFIGFNPDTLDCPSHAENPYAFKIYAIEEARSRGYEQILWVDASVYAVNDIEPVWEWMESHGGLFLEEAGHWVGNWCPDNVLNYFGTTREKAMKMPMFAGGYCGFDFRTGLAREFFAEWKEAMLNGMFKGSWDETRHDMTCGSIIANKAGLVRLYSPGGQFFSYIGNGYSEPLPTAVFHLQGI